MDSYTVDSEFLRPLVNGWLNKLEQGARGRSQWTETADECMMFYANSARAMWDPQYSRRFWKGAKLPRFRITINKAFEMVAIYSPSLVWEVPHRNVENKRSIDFTPDMIPQDPQGQQIFQQFMMEQQQNESRDKTISFLMDKWLNYTPNEQPGGGLSNHSHRSVVDALIKGRGCTAVRPYTMPGSERTLTGGFRIAPEDVLLDPDFQSVDECKWMSIRHVDVHTDVEKRFGLPKDSLKSKSTLESNWQYSELSTYDQASALRKEGLTNNLVIWHEIFSKNGVGCTTTTMDPTIRSHLDDTVGQYAYLAICSGVPYPLNLTPEAIRKGATDETIKAELSWPIPVWADDRWPVEFLDFYIHPQSAWPVAPMAPGLGELKLLNFLVSWMTNRVYSSSRDFWAVAHPYLEHYKEYLNNGEDQAIIPTPVGLKSPKEAIEILTQPETRQDMGKLIAFVSDMFDRRVGLTATVYGENEGGTQNRTAEETASKNRAVMIRPEYMQKQVVDWQSRVATTEAFVSRWFVTAKDVEPLLGQTGAMLWQQYVESTDVELVTRQFEYSISASSIRRPNRERDIANYQQVMNLFAPTMQGYGQQTGNYDSFNAMTKEWGRLHDIDLSELEIPSNEPSDEEKQQQAQMEQQAAQVEMGVKQADMQKKQAEAQHTAMETQLAPQEMQGNMQLEQAKLQANAQMEQMKVMAKSQMDQQKAEMDQMKMAGQMQIEQAKAESAMQLEQLKLQGVQMKQQADAQKMQMDQAKQQMDMQAEQAKQQMEIMFDTQKGELEQQQDSQEHIQEMLQDQEMHEQEVAQKQEMSEIDIEAKKQQVKIQAKAQREQSKSKPKPESKK